MAKAAWGIDIGKSALKAVLLKEARGGAEIAACEVIPIRSEEEGVADRENLVKEAFQEFTKKFKVKKEKLVVSLPGNVAFSRPINLPPVEEKKMREIVEYEAKQHIPFPIDDVLWDYHFLNPNGVKAGDEPKAIIFAIKKDIVNSYTRIFRDCGLTPDILQLPSLAMYNYVDYEYQSGDATVLIDVGAETTDLIILNGEDMWNRFLPIAGNDLIKRIVKRLDVDAETALELAGTSEKSPEGAKTFTAIQPVLKELVGEIHRTIGFYKSKAENVRFKELLLTGGGSKAVKMPRFLSSQLQMKVSRVNSFKKVFVPSSFDRNKLSDNFPSLGVAIGLALQGIGIGRVGINLMPGTEMVKLTEAKKKPYVAAGLFITALALGFGYVKANEQKTQLAGIASGLKKADSNTKKFKREIGNRIDLTYDLFEFDDMSGTTKSFRLPYEIQLRASILGEGDDFTQETWARMLKAPSLSPLAAYEKDENGAFVFRELPADEDNPDADPKKRLFNDDDGRFYLTKFSVKHDELKDDNTAAALPKYEVLITLEGVTKFRGDDPTSPADSRKAVEDILVTELKEVFPGCCEQGDIVVGYEPDPDTTSVFKLPWPWDPRRYSEIPEVWEGETPERRFFYFRVTIKREFIPEEPDAFREQESW